MPTTADTLITLPDVEWFTRDEVMSFFRFMPGDLQSAIRARKFPEPDIRLTPKSTRWKRSTIAAFLAKQQSRGA